MHFTPESVASLTFDNWSGRLIDQVTPRERPFCGVIATRATGILLFGELLVVRSSTVDESLQVIRNQ